MTTIAYNQSLARRHCINRPTRTAYSVSPEFAKHIFLSSFSIVLQPVPADRRDRERRRAVLVGRAQLLRRDTLHGHAAGRRQAVRRRARVGVQPPARCTAHSQRTSTSASAPFLHLRAAFCICFQVEVEAESEADGEEAAATRLRHLIHILINLLLVLLRCRRPCPALVAL